MVDKFFHCIFFLFIKWTRSIQHNRLFKPFQSDRIGWTFRFQLITPSTVRFELKNKQIDHSLIISIKYASKNTNSFHSIKNITEFLINYDDNNILNRRISNVQKRISKTLDIEFCMLSLAQIIKMNFSICLIKLILVGLLSMQIQVFFSLSFCCLFSF